MLFLQGMFQLLCMGNRLCLSGGCCCCLYGVGVEAEGVVFGAWTGVYRNWSVCDTWESCEREARSPEVKFAVIERNFARGIMSQKEEWACAPSISSGVGPTKNIIDARCRKRDIFSDAISRCTKRATNLCALVGCVWAAQVDDPGTFVCVFEFGGTGFLVLVCPTIHKNERLSSRFFGTDDSCQKGPCW